MKLTRFVCLFFIWATFKHRNYNDSSCLFISFCQSREVRQVRGEQQPGARPSRRTEGAGPFSQGDGRAQAVKPAPGWLQLLALAAPSSSFASSLVVSLQMMASSPAPRGCLPRGSSSTPGSTAELSQCRGKTKLIKNSFIWSHQLPPGAKEVISSFSQLDDNYPSPHLTLSV